MDKKKEKRFAAETGRRTPESILRFILLAAAAGMVAAGISNGGMYDIMVKAINICTECIGLG